MAKFGELDFYKNLKVLPVKLLEYIPEYKGCITVTEIDDNKNITYITKCSNNHDIYNGRRNSDDGSKFLKLKTEELKHHLSSIKKKFK